MALFNVEEHASIPVYHSQGGLPIVDGYPLASYQMSVTTSAQSAAFNSATRWVLISVGATGVYVAFGTNPTATVQSQYCPPNSIRGFAVISGQKVAGLAAS